MAQKKYNFDITVTGDSYAGILALPYVTPAVNTANSIADGLVRRMDGVTHKAVIKQLVDDGGSLQLAGCDFNDGASLTLKERVLTLSDLMVNEQICRKTIYPTWVSTQMNSRNADIQANFADFLMSVVADNAGAGIERGIYRGINFASNDVPGFLSDDGIFDNAGFTNSKLKGASYVRTRNVTNTTNAPLDAINIAKNLELAYNQATTDCPAILRAQDIQFVVSPQTYAFYSQYLAVAGGNGYINQVSNQDFAQLTYLGVPLKVAHGMFDGAIILTRAENLVVGTNLGTDLTDATMIPAYQYDGSDNVLVTMRFGLGMQSAVVSDAVVMGNFTEV